MVVIAILGLLASIVLVSVSSSRSKARIAAGLQFSSSVHHALGAYAVGIWDFDDQTANDTSGNNNNGTLNNFPASPWSADTPSGNGYALSFNGVNNYVIVNNNFVVNPTSLTISAWFKKMGPGANYECVLHKSSDSSIGASEYWLGVDLNDYLTATIGARTGVGWAAGRTSIVATIGDWYHLLASWNGSVVKIYVNGKYIKEYPLASYVNLTTPTRFGSSSNGTAYQFNGIIDDVRIYEQALSETQIKQLYVEGLEEHNLVSK